MNKQRRLIAILAVPVVSLLVVGVASANSDEAASAHPDRGRDSARRKPPKPKKPHPHERVVLAVDAEIASTDFDAEAWYLTMAGVSPQTVFMDERPGRDAGVFGTSAMAAQWLDLGFGDDPPNAFLSGSNLEPVPIEITDRPVHDSGTSEFSFHAVLLGEFADAELPSQIDHPVLMIDSVSPVDSDLLDLTVPSVGESGTVGGIEYTIISNDGGVGDGGVGDGEQIGGPGCPSWLACEQSGVSIPNDAAVLRVVFEQPVDVSAVFFLDAFTEFDGTQSQLRMTYDGGSLSLDSDPAETPDTAGFLEADISLDQVTTLTFETLTGTASLAGILLSSG
jgi:hypothetical protein